MAARRYSGLPTGTHSKLIRKAESRTIRLRTEAVSDVLAIIERLVYVGVESDVIISELPKEFEPADWEPKKTGLDVAC